MNRRAKIAQNVVALALSIFLAVFFVKKCFGIAISDIKFGSTVQDFQKKYGKNPRQYAQYHFDEGSGNMTIFLYDKNNEFYGIAYLIEHSAMINNHAMFLLLARQTQKKLGRNAMLYLKKPLSAFWGRGRYIWVLSTPRKKKYNKILFVAYDASRNADGKQFNIFQTIASNLPMYTLKSNVNLGKKDLQECVSNINYEIETMKTNK